MELIKKCAEDTCSGRYVVVTMGGRRRDITNYIIPEIVKVLARD